MKSDERSGRSLRSLVIEVRTFMLSSVYSASPLKGVCSRARTLEEDGEQVTEEEEQDLAVLSA